MFTSVSGVVMKEEPRVHYAKVKKSNKIQNRCHVMKEGLPKEIISFVRNKEPIRKYYAE